MNRMLLAAMLAATVYSAAACSDESPAVGSNDDADRANDERADATEGDTDEGNSVGELDAGKLDAGRGPATRPSDASTADASTAVRADSGTSPDARVPVVDGGASPGDKLKPKCVKKDSQVMIIGDSYINWVSHSFPQQIVQVSGGQRWRMEAIGAWSMGSGGAGFIPEQFKSSVMRDPDVHTVLMDGGGNDILVADPMLNDRCLEAGSSKRVKCQEIVSIAIRAAEKLLDDALAAGVRDVVYFFYPHVPVGTLLGGPAPNEILDYALPRVKDFCDSVEEKAAGKLRCHFVDLVPVFEGHPEWFFPLDIHPNSEGSEQIAKAVWAKMETECIGQKGPKDCCEM
ncbi:MAG: SGNH/GDSL hydrolase family protein [Polyangiales bacterium]